MKTIEISEDVYEKLADALDALPAGFTRTPSKLEIKLIKLVFSPEEALVASTLSGNCSRNCPAARHGRRQGHRITRGHDTPAYG